MKSKKFWWMRNGSLINKPVSHGGDEWNRCNLVINFPFISLVIPRKKNCVWEFGDEWQVSVPQWNPWSSMVDEHDTEIVGVRYETVGNELYEIYFDRKHFPQKPYVAGRNKKTGYTYLHLSRGYDHVYRDRRLNLPFDVWRSSDMDTVMGIGFYVPTAFYWIDPADDIENQQHLDAVNSYLDTLEKMCDRDDAAVGSWLINHGSHRVRQMYPRTMEEVEWRREVLRSE